MNHSRHDLSNLGGPSPLQESSSGDMTCPSCKITVMPGRPRSMCPFCGTFYDPQAEENTDLRGREASNLQEMGEESLRLPRIPNQRSDMVRVTGFGPLITDSLGVIHTYITGLLFRQSQNDPENLFLQLPSIRGSQERNCFDDSRRISFAMPNEFDGHDLSSSVTGTPYLGRCANSGQSNGRVSYLKREVDVHQLREYIDEALTNGDYSRVHDFYETTFSSFAELCAVFKINPDEEGAKLFDPQVKTELLNVVNEGLDDLPSFVRKTVLKGIINCFTTNTRLLLKDEVRALYVLLQITVFNHQSSYNVFAHLLKWIVNLHSGDHQLLIHWFSNMEQEPFRSIVKRLLQFITIREFPPTNGHKLPSISKSRWWIPSATKVLALLNSANDKSNQKLIPYTEFYNSALDHINLMSEYYRWQNPSKSNKFSYCQYPFILSIVAKKMILQRDSEQQMILNARKSLLNRALHQEVPDIDVFFLNLNIRRSHLVTDSLQEIGRKQVDLKKKLKVTFVGEPGLDMGGLTKEWFLLLIRQIFHEDYGMFVYHRKARCYWFSTAQTGNMREYNLIGVLMGLAVYNSIILDLHFPTACYKKILSPPVVPQDLHSEGVGLCKFTIEHLAEVMPDVTVGLKELLAYEGNVEDDFCMNFEVSVEEFGEVKTHILKDDGENTAVTNENREEYVQLYIDLILNKAIYQAFKAFYLGFHSVCASNALIMLRPEEVEMLVCGSPTIDMDALKKVTIYDGFREDEPIIRDFWDIVKSFSPDLQKQFLRFTTGSDRVPVGGMSEMTFKISSLNRNTDMLPISHTCFNQLVMPRYKEKNILREKLVIAISNAEGFGLE